MSRKSTQFPIVNGLFGGSRSVVSLREALRLFKFRSAVPCDMKGNEIAFPHVNDVTGEIDDFTFTAIKLTHQCYMDVVASSTESSKVRAMGIKPTIAVERAMNSSESCKSIAPIQREEVYRGSREDGSAGNVRTLRVLRKAKPLIYQDRSMAGRTILMADFSNWTERDRFPARRFNPDLLPKPLIPARATA